MNIAVFTDTYRPEINGVVTSIDIFRRELEAQGHTVYVFCPRYFDRDHPDPEIYNFPSTPFLFRMMTERRFAYPSLRIFRLISKLKLDVIHSHVPGNIGVYALLICRFRRIPHVHTYHTLFTEYTHYMPIPRNIARNLIAVLSKRFCDRCQRVIAPSGRLKDELLGYGVSAPIDVIPTGIDMRADRSITPAEILRRRYSLPDGKHILLMVGRIGREKNISFLLRVVRLLKQRRSDFVFVIVGDGPDRPPLQNEVAELGLRNEVVFTGYVPRDEVFSFSNASALFTIASVTETQGVVLLEAMAMGTPVVAVDAMGVSDLMADGRGGIACRLDQEEFAAQVERLLDDRRLYRRKSAEAKEKAHEWSIGPMTGRLVESYERAISDFRAHGHVRHGRRSRRTPTTPEPGRA